MLKFDIMKVKRSIRKRNQPLKIARRRYCVETYYSTGDHPNDMMKIHTLDKTSTGKPCWKYETYYWNSKTDSWTLDSVGRYPLSFRK